MFRDIIIPAIKTTWRKKTLWFISILTIAPIILANEWITGVKTIAAITDPTDHFITLSSFAEELAVEGLTVTAFVSTFFNQPIESIASVLSFIVVVALVLFFVWITVNAYAMVIMNLSAKKQKTLSINDSLNQSTDMWLPLAYLNGTFFLVRILIIALFLIAFSKITLDPLPLTYTILAFGATALLMALSFILRFATLHIILRKQNLREAIQSGIALFKTNKLVCYELTLLTAIITMVTLAIIEQILLLIFSTDEFSTSIVNILLFGSGFLAFVKGLLFVLLLITIGGIVLLFQNAVWVLWFEQNDKRHHSYIGRIFGILKRSK